MLILTWEHFYILLIRPLSKYILFVSSYELVYHWSPSVLVYDLIEYFLKKKFG